ncbi:MAG TPA: phosphatidylserine/phosphatidylglycerophosphate/cardiolipin synthase family protein [Thermotogota bacterium]|nr:phosphatidylserine/phosphatidylglycerophosphate/cardiolipin synthase family protein [Thermotogota bacterium]HRW91716.1 phosphatidylserine/phosphatidylglycerophosphate/cardiolipin synthase family protein [Thermotogota bacterium]
MKQLLFPCFLLVALACVCIASTSEEFFFGCPAFESILDQRTASRVTEGNQLVLLTNGSAYIETFFALLESAEHHVNLQTFIFLVDSMGSQVLEILQKKAEQGIPCRLLFDPIGVLQKKKSYLLSLNAPHFSLRAFSRQPFQIGASNYIAHEKILEVDSRVALVGGANVDEVNALGYSSSQAWSRGVNQAPHLDMNFLVRGPAVAEIQSVFFQTWNHIGLAEEPFHELPMEPAATPGSARVRVIHQQPYLSRDLPFRDVMILAIETAQDSIDIQTPFFSPYPYELYQALIRAAQRGVQVRILTNSRQTCDRKHVYDSGRYYYDEIVSAGVQIFEYQAQFFHGKAALFDGVYAVVGSANVNVRSLYFDGEIVVAVEDPGFAQDLTLFFSEALAFSQLVSREELERESFFVNQVQKICSSFAWLN